MKVQAKTIQTEIIKKKLTIICSDLASERRVSSSALRYQSEPMQQLRAEERSSLIDGDAGYDSTNVRPLQPQPYSSTKPTKTNGVHFTHPKTISRVSQQDSVSSKTYNSTRMPSQSDSGRSNDDIPSDTLQWPSRFSSNQPLPTTTANNSGFCQCA